MRLLFLVAVIAGLVVGVVFAAAKLTTDGGDESADPSVEPELSLELVDRFVAAWAASDADGIHSVLDDASVGIVSPVDIAELLANFDREVTVGSREIFVERTSGGGATFRARVTTAYFGVLEYAIEAELVGQEGFYRFVWSPSLIHPELREGYELRSVIEWPRRGTIWDRNGTELAVTKTTTVMGLNRVAVRDRQQVTEVLIELGATPEQVDAAFNSPYGLDQRVPVHTLPDERAEEAIDLTDPVSGIILYRELRRVHPLGPAAAHVVGYTRELTANELAARSGEGFRIGDRVGATGLEESFEEVLAGSIGADLRIVDSSGATVRSLVSRAFMPSQDVHTTLSAEVLLSTFARMEGRPGAAVVLDPGSNEILALVSVPSFDPDAFEANDGVRLQEIVGDPLGPLTNRALNGLYSPGSTFKLITGAAGLVAGVVESTDRLMCGATWAGVDPPRANWEESRGLLLISEGLMLSCNPVFYEIGLRLYNNTDGALSEMAREFGFGSPTGLAALRDEAGLVPDAEWKSEATGEPWYPGDEVNISIGQGALLVTPLQLANAYSTFVTGQLRSPLLVVEEEVAIAGTLQLEPADRAELQRGLELVTGPDGTAHAAFWSLGYRDFGGKSGTAEDAGEQQHVLFVAFSPAASPQALAAVVLEDGQSGSLEAGPIARDAVLAALSAP